MKKDKKGHNAWKPTKASGRYSPPKKEDIVPDPEPPPEPDYEPVPETQTEQEPPEPQENVEPVEDVKAQKGPHGAPRWNGSHWVPAEE